MAYNDTDINLKAEREKAYIRQQNRILSQWNRDHEEKESFINQTDIIFESGMVARLSGEKVPEHLKIRELKELSPDIEPKFDWSNNYSPDFSDLINDDVKNFIVEHEDIVKIIRQLNRAVKLKDLDKVELLDYQIKSALELAGITNQEYIDKLFDEVVKECENYYDSIYRMKQRVYFMFSFAGEQPVTFGTLTFTDECLENTSPETRRKYVSRYIAEHSTCYLANIDYGKENEREHYHFIAVGKFTAGDWTHGFDFYKIVRSKNSDVSRTSKYIRKLINHAKKDTAGKLIYSRNIPRIIKTEKGYKVLTKSGTLDKEVKTNDSEPNQQL